MAQDEPADASAYDTNIEHSLTPKNVDHLLCKPPTKHLTTTTSTNTANTGNNASQQQQQQAAIYMDTRPRLLLMGCRRSGKSSISKVVFNKMSPHETLFLESNFSINYKVNTSSLLIDVELLDFPGSYDISDSKLGGGGNNGGKNNSVTSNNSGNINQSSIPNTSISTGISTEKLFSASQNCLIYVIDAQSDDEYNFTEAIDYLVQIVKTVEKLKFKNTVQLHILIHKVDGDAYLSDEHKLEIQNDIKRSVYDELADIKSSFRPQFYCTSIYDHSVYECFSKIVQQLIPNISLYEKLLDSLVVACKMEKVFLFDIVTKIYVATDSNPVDIYTYEICSDMIDVVLDVSSIYGSKDSVDASKASECNTSCIQLSNDFVLYLREVNQYLALVCLMRSDSYMKQGLLEYNFSQLKTAVASLLDSKQKQREAWLQAKQQSEKRR